MKLDRITCYLSRTRSLLKSVGKVEVLLFASVGGHLDQLLDLADAFSPYEYLIVVNDVPPEREILREQCVRITHGERNFLQAVNIVECLMIMIRTRPKVVLSTGAAPAVWFSLFGKLSGSKVIFIESIARVDTLSMTGRLTKFLADDFFAQWPELAARSGTRYAGTITTSLGNRK